MLKILLQAMKFRIFTENSTNFSLEMTQKQIWKIPTPTNSRKCKSYPIFLPAFFVKKLKILVENLLQTIFLFSYIFLNFTTCSFLSYEVSSGLENFWKKQVSRKRQALTRGSRKDLISKNKKNQQGVKSEITLANLVKNFC